MTKAEEYSFNIGSELYNHLAPEQQKLWRKDIEDAWNNAYCEAEKDLELTWQDMFDIFRLVNEVLDDYAEGKTKKEVGEEVLKRFKGLKHVK